MNGSEIHAFVIWPKAMGAKDRILADMRAHAEVLAAVTAAWPADVSPSDAYARFYGPNLADAVGKVKRAGAGEFCIVIVRIAEPAYDWRMTQRGYEFVNLPMFDMKWKYREWVGGLHRVHGTNSVAEARRDVMLLTGRSLDDWARGDAGASDVTVLPGTNGWRSLAEVFAFLEETCAYAVLRNADGLPDGIDLRHEDVDLLVDDARSCASLLGARKLGAGAAYAVRVAGVDLRLDLREVGDGYYDEAWERRMLANRVRTQGGVATLGDEDLFHSLLYHVIYMKRQVAPDYWAKLRKAAAKIGIESEDWTDWSGRLGRFMAENGYRFTTPADRSVRLDFDRIDWRLRAMTAKDLFGLESARPDIVPSETLPFAARLGGRDVRVTFSRMDRSCVANGHELQAKLSGACPASVVRPLSWHVGDGGVFAMTETVPGVPIRRFADSGARLDAVARARLAESVRALVAALDATGIVHRNVGIDNVFVTPEGRVTLTGFEFGVDRAAYRKESPHFRRKLAKRLAALGGEGVPRPGEWNDRYALARALRYLPPSSEIEAVAEEFEREARAGKGSLAVSRRKITLRLLALGAELAVRGALSPRRRKSAAFRRTWAFVRNALGV